MARHRWRNCAATGFALRAIKHKKRPTENPNLAQSKECWRLGRRIAAFLRGARPRGLIFPCENARSLLRETSAEERSDDGADQREKREERREKMATSSILCISTVSPGGYRRSNTPMGRWPDEFKVSESREKREERREKREERRDHKKGRQRSPN